MRCVRCHTNWLRFLICWGLFLFPLFPLLFLSLCDGASFSLLGIVINPSRGKNDSDSSNGINNGLSITRGKVRNAVPERHARRRCRIRHRQSTNPLKNMNSSRVTIFALLAACDSVSGGGDWITDVGGEKGRELKFPGQNHFFRFCSAAFWFQSRLEGMGYPN